MENTPALPPVPPPPAKPASPTTPVATSPPAADALSVSRPMTDEERAALEEVYRERGCGVECDC